MTPLLVSLNSKLGICSEAASEHKQKARHAVKKLAAKRAAKKTTATRPSGKTVAAKTPKKVVKKGSTTPVVAAGQRAVVNVDLADLWRTSDRKAPSKNVSPFLRTLAWGDEVEVLEITNDFVRVQTVDFQTKDDGAIEPVPREAFIVPRKSLKGADGTPVTPHNVLIPKDQNRVLRVNFVDVQQGDGSVIETPDGKVILVDGGDNQLFARYLASRFRGTSVAEPKVIDCILVTHGDADHFEGLTEIFESETNAKAHKRLFIAPRRVYHNGLVKRPSTKNSKKVSDKELLGPTEETDEGLMLTGLVDTLLDVPDDEMNTPFRKWKHALTTWNNRNQAAHGDIEFRRLSFGMDDAFDFMKQNDLEISVLGPFVHEVDGKPALKFLGDPPKGPRIGHDSLSVGEDGFSGFSASHTINGHSIVFRLRYGGFSFLFSGDLNDEASRILARGHQRGKINLRSEVFKVPHHGSADFSGAFFQMVSPVVSVVSSGDESSRKEFIHPRATLMGALGRHSRMDEPLIFVTEMVAFFEVEGWARVTDKKKDEKRGEFFAFSRAAFGMVKTRTDGQRLLVYTDSGVADMKEAYCYSLDDVGAPVPAKVVRA